MRRKSAENTAEKMDLIDKVRNTLNRYFLIKSGSEIIVGLSGGADSMCLLNCLYKLSKEYGFFVSAAHVNHGIRGEEADRDENFARENAEKLGLKFYSTRYDVPKISEETGESEEECGRRLRYEYFSSLSEKIKKNSGRDVFIATAHNLNDCAETFLLNVARGASLKGLCSIPPKRGNIIRPLINCSRDEIEKFDFENGIDFVTDSTNNSDDYSRNKIRHICLPVITEINPSFYKVFANTLETVRKDEKFFEDISDKIISFSYVEKYGCYSAIKFSDEIEFLNSRYGLDLNSNAVLYEAVKNLFLIFGSDDFEYRHIKLFAENFRDKVSVNLPGNIIVNSDGKYIWREKHFSENTEEKNLRKINIESYNKKIDYSDKRKISENCLADSEKIKGYTLRYRREGDKFFPNGGRYSKSLKKMFAENRVPSFLRDSCLIMEKDGNILWCEFVGTSKYACPDENSAEIVRISI